MLVALVAVELRLKYPILHFSLLRDRMFRISNIVIFFGFALWIGSLFVLPLYLQQLGGFSAFQSGLTTCPPALGWIAMSTVASRIYKRVGPRRMIAAGLAGASLLTLGFALGAAGARRLVNTPGHVCSGAVHGVCHHSDPDGGIYQRNDGGDRQGFVSI